MKEKLYTFNDVTQTYEKVYDLLVTKNIIKMYSTNKDDIRNKALDGLNLSSVKKVLELGCGYGFFIEKLKNQLHKDAVIIGIDLVENNRLAYLNSVSSINYKGEFIKGSSELINEMKDKKFDLIIASYSLYFFPDLIDNIARVMKEDGIFISLTHSKYSLQEVIQFIPSCLEMSQIIAPESSEMTSLSKLFMNFSLEEGGEKLEEAFASVEKIKFNNEMVFPYENIDDCISYINYKKFLIFKEVLDSKPEKIDEVQHCISQKIMNHAREKGNIILNKDDAVFICRKPKY